jgi:hypothetical protein
MKKHFLLICLSGLLLITVSYVQILHKILVKEGVTNTVLTDCGEEPIEKSSEENTRETDQDEDPFRIGEMMMVSSENSQINSKNENYSLGLLGYYPEIVSPPPQN